MSHLQSETAPNKASQCLSCLFCLTGRGYQYASHNFFLFWTVPLKSVKKKKSIHACILINKISKKKKKSIYECILINKISKKKKKKTIFFFFWLLHLQQHIATLN